MQHFTHSDQETKNVGRELAATLQSGDVVLLEGNLGAGKTTFVKGLAEGLGLSNEITSPTFTLMNVYKLQANSYNLHTLVHIDTYRLKEETELLHIGVEDYLGQPGVVTFIEWPEKIPNIIKNIRQRRTSLGLEKVLRVCIEHKGNDERAISID